MHDFVNETRYASLFLPQLPAEANERLLGSITTDEWINTIQFLTRVGQTCTPIRQEFILLSDILGISALVDALNNPPIHGAMESSVLGPFFTEDAPDGECLWTIAWGTHLTAVREVAMGESIASEGKGEYMYVEGRVLSTDGTPVANARIETWETDSNGERHNAAVSSDSGRDCAFLGSYDTQYSVRDQPDCRGRLQTGPDGHYGYRAVVPVPYPIPGDVSRGRREQGAIDGSRLCPVSRAPLAICSRSLGDTTCGRTTCTS